MAEKEARTLRDLSDRIWATQKLYHEAIEATLRIGLWVTVTHGENRIEVTVVDHSWERVKVRNPDSGKEYWVYANRLVEHETLRLRTPTPAGSEPEEGR